MTRVTPENLISTILMGVLRGRVSPAKSNWAFPVTDSPFYAYPVTGGITFGFGGVAITPDIEVKNGCGGVIEGFYAAGNAIGELFYNNYPGGTGLINGAVYGVLAAGSAANTAKTLQPSKS